jgi:hypothetical protein
LTGKTILTDIMENAGIGKVRKAAEERLDELT